MAYSFKIKEFSNYDGDSFDLTLDLGFDLVYHTKVRIKGVDTPGLSRGSAIHKKAGKLAKEKASAFVESGMANGKAFFISETYCGKYGRPLGDIVVDSDNSSLRFYLISNNYGVKYNGEAKSKIAEAHENNFTILQKRGEI